MPKTLHVLHHAVCQVTAVNSGVAWLATSSIMKAAGETAPHGIPFILQKDSTFACLAVTVLQLLQLLLLGRLLSQGGRRMLRQQKQQWAESTPQMASSLDTVVGKRLRC